MQGQPTSQPTQQRVQLGCRERQVVAHKAPACVQASQAACPRGSLHTCTLGSSCNGCGAAWWPVLHLYGGAVGEGMREDQGKDKTRVLMPALSAAAATAAVPPGGPYSTCAEC